MLYLCPWPSCFTSCFTHQLQDDDFLMYLYSPDLFLIFRLTFLIVHLVTVMSHRRIKLRVWIETVLVLLQNHFILVKCNSILPFAKVKEKRKKNGVILDSSLSFINCLRWENPVSYSLKNCSELHNQVISSDIFSSFSYVYYAASHIDDFLVLKLYFFSFLSVPFSFKLAHTILLIIYFLLTFVIVFF